MRVKFRIFLLFAALLAGCQSVRAAPIITQTVAASRVASAAGTATATPVRLFSSTPTSKSSPTTEVPAVFAAPTATPMEGMLHVQAGRAVVPILLYHHVSDKGNTRYTVPVHTFRAQIKILHEEGYQTITISRLAEVIRSGGDLPEKVVVLTFDDGYLDIYLNAFPILQEFGFQGVAYIITSTLEKQNSYGYMQEHELKELLSAGWEIGSHSVTHTDLKRTKLGIGNEMKQSKKTLETLLGVPVRSFSYPYGIANQSIKELAAAEGYDSAVGLDIVATQTTRRLYYLSRREVERSISLNAFRKLLEPAKDEWIAATQPAEEPGQPGNTQ